LRSGGRPPGRKKMGAYRAGRGLTGGGRGALRSVPFRGREENAEIELGGRATFLTVCAGDRERAKDEGGFLRGGPVEN